MTKTNKFEKLAIHGGTPVRKYPMPFRKAFGPKEMDAVLEFIEYSNKMNLDPSYQGFYEEKYINLFVSYMGGGYADAVATGSAAVYIALSALELPPGTLVGVSPITDPGTISAIILLKLKPCVIDTAPGCFNIDSNTFLSRYNEAMKAIVVVHSLGRAADILNIVNEANQLKVSVVEDCSQSHGARHNNELVGKFGDISAFSTMYRKAHISGGSGGIVYSKNKTLLNRAMAYSDRGKPRWYENFDDRDPRQFLFPALNFHTDEISCAIASASISRLDETINKRLKFLLSLSIELKNRSRLCSCLDYSGYDSPFVIPIIVNTDMINCSKKEFAQAILGEGIGLNPEYNYLVTNWPWAVPYLSDKFSCPNASEMIEKSFMLYINENYGEQEVDDILNAIDKVENFYMK